LTAEDVEAALQEVAGKDPGHTFSGDVTGSGDHTDLGDASVALTIAADAVENSMIADDAVDSDQIADGAIDTAHIGDDQVTEDKIADNALTGTVMGNVADANVIGGVPVLHRVDIAGGAAGDTDVTLTHKERVIDVWAVHTAAGEASDTIQVKNGANAITDAMDWSGVDTVVVRAGQIDDAQHEIAAGGTLRVTTTDDDGGSDVGAGVVYVLALRVA
jgi:hypothetical protein